MFVWNTPEAKLPIKVWLPDETSLDEICAQQAQQLAQLPFLQNWVCLMPDAHAGFGMPIGGVIAAEDVIIPNAVGVDIGCGMAFVATNIPVSVLKETQTPNGNLVQAIVGDILRNIPVGFAHHKLPQPCYTLDTACQNLHLYQNQPQLLSLLDAGTYQVGTLGGGNHFIELQEDENGMLCVMLHSGSRNLGKQICDYFHQVARTENAAQASAVPDEWRLAYLSTNTQTGKDYLAWMNLALDFAQENREKMMLVVQAVLRKYIGKYTSHALAFDMEINCHHNYAALETHFGKQVWVHRKGATRANLDELAVIPGAMGSYSYVVRGLGNAESFCTSSHGAGRSYSRKAARAAFTAQQVLTDLGAHDVVLGKRNKTDVADESRFAYKDIEQVMQHQSDLVQPVKRLFTVGVVKG